MFRYDIMLMCWNESPLKRPTFTELRAKFDAMLLADKNEDYIDLRIDQNKLYYQLITTTPTGDSADDSVQSSSDHDVHGLCSLSEKELLPNKSPKASFLSPTGLKSHRSSSADQVFSKQCFDSERGYATTGGLEGSERDQAYRNTGRPVSMYISRDEEKREHQNPYVDDPSSIMAATALSVPNTDGWPTLWRSDGAINTNQMDNIELQTREPTNFGKQIGPEITISFTQD